MGNVKVLEDGTVEIPESIRELYGMKPGSELEVVKTDEGVELRPVSPFPQTTLDEVTGCLDYDGPQIPTEALSGLHAHQLRMEREEESEVRGNDGH